VPASEVERLQRKKLIEVTGDKSAPDQPPGGDTVNQEATEAIARLTAERDQLQQRVEELQAELEKASGDDDGPDEFATVLKPLGTEVIASLRQAGYTTLKKLRDASDEKILDLPSIGEGRLTRIRELLA